MPDWHTYALSFYGSKMILGRPNYFGWVPIVLDRSNLVFWGPNHFGQVQIIEISSEKSNLNLTKNDLDSPKTIRTQPKQFVPVDPT